MDDSNAYEEKKAKEQAWYERQTPHEPGIIRWLLHHPIVFSYDRFHFNHEFPKGQMVSVARRRFGGQAGRLLIAPCGRGADYRYLQGLCPSPDGMDLSAVALKGCPQEMRVVLGDLLAVPYPDDTFDLLASALFFHHMKRFGFLPFLREFYRILKPGGGLIILEPSLWYPLNLITRPIKTLFGNPFDEVEDEGPLRPRLMLRGLEQAGFASVQAQAATFSHVSFYVPVARFVNDLSNFFLDKWPFKYLGWLVVYSAEKPGCDPTR